MNNKMGWMGLVLLVLGSANALADVEVRDPQHLLEQIDTYLGPAPSFTEAYKLGDLGEYALLHKDCAISCQEGGCYQQCISLPGDKMTRSVTQCDAKSATIELYDGTTETVTADQFQAWHGNLVRGQLMHLDTSLNIKGYLVATLVQDRAFKTDDGKDIPAKEIVFEFHPETGIPFKVRYSVMKGFPAVSQIVRMAVFGDWMYQIQKVTRH